jgi:hypothetical protein
MHIFVISIILSQTSSLSQPTPYKSGCNKTFPMDEPVFVKKFPPPYYCAAHNTVPLFISGAGRQQAQEGRQDRFHYFMMGVKP